MNAWSVSKENFSKDEQGYIPFPGKHTPCGIRPALPRGLLVVFVENQIPSTCAHFSTLVVTEPNSWCLGTCSTFGLLLCVP